MNRTVWIDEDASVTDIRVNISDTNNLLYCGRHRQCDVDHVGSTFVNAQY